MKVRATLTLRNAAIINARKKLCLSQKNCAKAAGIPLMWLTAFEKMTYDSESTVQGKHARALAGFLEIPFEDVAPPELAGKVIQHTTTREIDVPAAGLIGMSQATQVMALPAPEIFDIAQDKAALLALINEILTYREGVIIKLRYGLAGDTPHTQAEIGKILKITRSRVWEIQGVAVNKLRHVIESREAQE